MMQIKPWDFMVKYTPQREWIEGHGIMVAFAMFFGGVSGGLYLASLFFGNLTGMIIAWVLAALAGLVDMAHLSKRMRFWRMALRPGSSWISRGFILIFLFLGAAGIQILITYFAPGNAFEIFFKVVAGIFAFGVAIYSGFAIGIVGAIKLWNTGLVPILYVVSGLAGGLAVVMLVSLNKDAASLVNIGNYLLAALVVNVVFVVTYFWSATYSSVTARDSAVRVMKGKIAPAFWIGVIMIGLIIPIVLVAPFSLSNTSASISFGAKVAFSSAAVCAVIGGIMLRYVILKGGMYSPLLPDE
jgi:formate-dependent nitrite reductase membrane component NrfD